MLANNTNNHYNCDHNGNRIERYHSLQLHLLPGPVLDTSNNRPSNTEVEGPNNNSRQNAGNSDVPIIEVDVSRSKYPESAQHIEDAIANGQPEILTIDRAGATENRKESLNGVPTVSGMDRDEYPPAMSREGGAGASVRCIPKPDNRGSGSSIGNQLRNYPDGTKYKIRITE